MRLPWMTDLTCVGCLFIAGCALSPGDPRRSVVVESAEQSAGTATPSSDTAQGHVERGIALGLQGHLDRAIDEFQHALRLEPEHVDAHINLGLAFEKKGEWGRAIAEYERAIKARPDHAGAHGGLGVAIHRKGDLTH